MAVAASAASAAAQWRRSGGVVGVGGGGARGGDAIKAPASQPEPRPGTWQRSSRSARPCCAAPASLGSK